MDTRENPIAYKLVAKLGEKVEELHEELNELPETAEEYLDMELEERLKIAQRIIKAHVDMSTYAELRPENGVQVTIPTEEGQIADIEARVGYSEFGWTGGINPAIVIWIRAIDPSSGLKSNFNGLPRLEPSATAHNKWWEHESLRDQYKDSIEAMDLAVCKLIEDEVATQRTGLARSAFVGVAVIDV